MRKITDASPRNVVSVSQYHSGLGEALGRDPWRNFGREQLAITDPDESILGGTYTNPPVMTRLVVNRYGDRDADFAGDYLINIKDISKPSGRRVRNMQPGTMLVKLALSPFNSRDDHENVRPKDYFVSPCGILLPTGRMSWLLYGNEEGYFPVQTDKTSPVVATASVPPTPPHLDIGLPETLGGLGFLNR